MLITLDITDSTTATPSSKLRTTRWWAMNVQANPEERAFFKPLNLNIFHQHKSQSTIRNARLKLCKALFPQLLHGSKALDMTLGPHLNQIRKVRLVPEQQIWGGGCMPTVSQHKSQAEAGHSSKWHAHSVSNALDWHQHGISICNPFF